MSERGSRVRVRPVVEEDEAAFIAAARRSLGLHHGWVRSPTTPATFKEYLARFDGLRSFGFVLELIATGELVGYVNISQVVHDAYQRGILGYAIFVPHQCQGLMTEGLGLVREHAFRELGLHRLEAEIQPENQPSLRLVKRLDFHQEGISPGLICIDEEWKDHERWAVVDVSGARVSASEG